jgi:F0F1-type ATP synthase membrane subunit c/vacuolar-type H+-ATPase subunit K
VFVYVTVTMFVDNSNEGLVAGLAVTVTGIGAGIRAGTATRDLMNHPAIVQKQRELDKARQQPIPKF